MFKVIFRKKTYLCLIGVMIFSLVMLYILLLFKPVKEFDKEEITELDNIKEVVVNSSYAEVNLMSSDTSDLRVCFYGKEKSIPKLIVTSENNKVNVSLIKPLGITFYSGKMKLDIYIPKSYTHDLTVKTPSKPICLSGLKLNKLFCESSSGDILIKSVTIAAAELETASGDQTLSDFNGDLKAISSAGIINVDYSFFNNNVIMETASGSIDLKLPENAEFHLDAKSSSGTINSDFQIELSGTMEKSNLEGEVKSSKNEINLITASGNIYIHK